MPGEYMKFANDGQFDPDRNVLHFATVPAHCSVQKKIPMEFSIGISRLAAGGWIPQGKWLYLEPSLWTLVA